MENRVIHAKTALYGDVPKLIDIIQNKEQNIKFKQSRIIIKIFLLKLRDFCFKVNFPCRQFVIEKFIRLKFTARSGKIAQKISIL